MQLWYPWKLYISMHIYIYILCVYMCVCLCVCVSQNNRSLFFSLSLKNRHGSFLFLLLPINQSWYNPFGVATIHWFVHVAISAVLIPDNHLLMLLYVKPWNTHAVFLWVLGLYSLSKMFIGIEIPITNLRRLTMGISIPLKRSLFSKWGPCSPFFTNRDYVMDK